MHRNVPLIVLASASSSIADEVATRLRLAGNVVYVTHSAEGCLRVAASVAPDVVLLDPALPPRLVRYLKAHPASAHAQILHLDVPHPAPMRVPRPVTSPPAKAGPHAA